MLKLSIITINFNNDTGLLKTIESVINQTYVEFEYIIIDGGSTDNSVETIKKYADKINFWVSENDKGIYNAMNNGILHSKGEYCLFLNSGDWLCNEDVLKEVFSNTLTEDIVYGHQLKEVNGKLIEDVCLDIHYYSFKTLKDSHMPHQSTFIKRSLFIDKIGLYEEKYSIISDWAFVMLAIFKYDCTIRRIDSFISVYDTMGISSIEKTKKIQQKERRDFLDYYFHLFMIDYDNMENFMNKPYIKFLMRTRDLINKILRRN